VRQRAHERAVFDASADGIAVLDGEGRVLRWNPAAAELTAVSAEAVIGQKPPFPLPAPGEKLTFQLGTGRWLDVVSAQIEETGELVVDFRDVTAAKELEEAKDLFLATTSHELRTPITIVRGFASTLDTRWDKLSDAERRSAVRTIAERSRSLGQLMDHLLLGARAGAEEQVVRDEPFDLAARVHAATLGLPVLSDKHRVEVSIGVGLPQVRGDALATDIVLGQLLENAFKYSPKGGLIRVAAWTGPGARLRTVRAGRQRRPQEVRRRRPRPLHRAQPGQGAGRRRERPSEAGRRHPDEARAENCFAYRIRHTDAVTRWSQLS
jgi:signal transduction histidine kinase